MNTDTKKNYNGIYLSQIEIPIEFKHNDTYTYFGDYSRYVKTNGVPTSIPQEDWESWLKKGGSDDGYGEYTCLTAAVSDALLDYNRCIIHASAIRHNDHAWLISGPSGVGKSTQTKYLQTLLPGKFNVICGDRPVLEVTNHSVIVHPSPWNGKENWKGADAAPLKGLILLNRADQNDFTCIKPKDAVFPVLDRMILTYNSAEVIKKIASLVDRILNIIPVYMLSSNTVPESTCILIERLFKESD